MAVTAEEFPPPTGPDTSLIEPEAARITMRDVVNWLAARLPALPPEQQRQLTRTAGVRSGLFAAEYPTEYGGRDMPEQVLVELREQAGASGLPYSDRILTGDDGPSRLFMDATSQQRHTWLPPLIGGRLTRCLAMTEQAAGSDLNGMRATATRTSAGWTLSGRKFLISNAAGADLAIVLAQAVDGDHLGPTFFVFPTDVPGWRVLRRLPGMNPLADQYEVELAGIDLTDAAVLGGPARVGGATGMALEWMAHGRIAIAARAVGLSRWALGVARRHAHARTIAGTRLSEHQYIREFIVGSYVKIEAARCLVRQAAAAVDSGRLAAREAATAKLYATESACEVIDDAIQVLGGRGWLTEYGLDWAYAEARMFRLVDGASEVMKETIFHLLPAGDGTGTS
jgi:acyl-CoA dehydrogenase